MIKSRFFINFLVILGGAAGAQAINLAFTPIVTRLFSPEAFGFLGTYVSFLGILLPLVTLCYPMAIILPEKNITASNIEKGSIFISFILTCFFSIVLLTTYEVINLLIGWQDSPILYFFLCISLFVSALLEVYSYVVLRYKLFRLKSNALIINSLILNLSKVFVGFYYPNVYALIVVTFFSVITHVALIKYLMRSEIDNFDFKLSFTFTRRYKNLPLFRAPQTCVAALNQASPVFLLASMFDLKSSGYFVLCRTVMLVPVTLIAKSVNDALMPDIAEMVRRGEQVLGLIVKTTALLAAIAIIPCLIVFFWGGELFVFIFGESWYKAGEYASWFSIWIFFNFINRPCVAAIPALFLEKKLLLNSLLNSLLSIGGFLLAFNLFNNDVMAVIFFSIFGIFPQLMILMFVYFEIRKEKESI
ncbi:oligosaccharide flippase family protein [Pseudoalteromonas sp. 2CM39R]|uniref:lipopolysaccharide biosynthesis protein n=1 Tax=Pseudoalteromonas sp. 2CM39R TaxID=2929856 RepID=UPI0020C0138B|nr:oligosaccharide flippase family protein [Pseudoalteromonas sp. 2CM39R]MCK8130758.1 oligosaccharide flippase family protein [Pseudoalteromonas sp. 2CM39R]